MCQCILCFNLTCCCYSGFNWFFIFITLKIWLFIFETLKFNTCFLVQNKLRQLALKTTANISSLIKVCEIVLFTVFCIQTNVLIHLHNVWKFSNCLKNSMNIVHQSVVKFCRLQFFKENMQIKVIVFSNSDKSKQGILTLYLHNLAFFCNRYHHY